MTVSVIFGTLMGTIDASIVNVALPHIRRSVGATVEAITWITTGFVIANVIVMPLTGFLGRLFGQKRVHKVVQRVPVRIVWTKPPDVALAAGLSADVIVEIR